MKNASPYEGKLDLGSIELNCYVTESGERLISQADVFRAFGRENRGARRTTEGLIKVPPFMDAKNLLPFIEEDLHQVITPIKFANAQGGNVIAYKAEIIPLVSDLYLKAREAGVLTEKQLMVAKASELLVRSLAKVGIIALIDEATGYQHERERDELQKILKQYISEELLAWEKKFPDEFYKEIFRLRAWDFTVNGIKKRPGIIGTWTNKLVYNQLPKGILQELKKKTPKSAAGNYTARFHQNLTVNIGEPHLEKQMVSIITLMNISKDWREFIKFFNKKFGQQELDLD
jgi:hypothetical protein